MALQLVPSQCSMIPEFKGEPVVVWIAPAPTAQASVWELAATPSNPPIGGRGGLGTTCQEPHFSAAALARRRVGEAVPRSRAASSRVSQATRAYGGKRFMHVLLFDSSTSATPFVSSRCQNARNFLQL